MIFTQNNPVKKTNGFAGLYVHFPYCIQKCSYCDFYSIGNGKNSIPTETDLFEAYRKEFFLRLEKSPELNDFQFDTIFFGGGTPSLADRGQMQSLLSFFHSHLKIPESTEISLEANPEDISEKMLNELFEMGFNRINVGVQTFDGKLLEYIGRYYDKEKYNTLLQTLRQSPFKRFGADLIYGIPGQTKESFLEDVKKILDSDVTHISMYALTIERGTDYSRKIKENKVLPPNEELQELILLELPEIMERNNFNQYEVSNYCKSGEESRHNLKYWTMENYLALGPGAHGYVQSGRYANQRSQELYLKNQFGLVYEKPEYQEELALSLFRLFLPIEIDSFLEPIPLKKELILNKIEEWKLKGFCKFVNGIFQWNKNSVLHLDQLIFEIATL